MNLNGGCLCGSIRYSCDAEPALTAICHCPHCQKQTSSPFSLVVAVPRGTLKIAGQTLKTFDDVGESGLPVRRKFCGSCGNTSFQSLTAALSAASLNRAIRGPEESQTIACPRCSQKYPPTTRFCGRCGIPIGTSSLDWRPPKPVEVLCKHCGATYPAAAQFCGGCGKPFNP